MSSNTPSNRGLKETSPKRSSTHDLKNQLFEFQKKLNKRKPAQSSSNEPEIHLPPVIAPTALTPSPSTSTSNNVGGSQQPDELRLTARKLAGRQRLSMPTLPNNPNGAGPNNNNVDFLSELSDGLLVESRKLAYENKQLKAKLKEIDVDTFQKQINNLTIINKKLSEKEEEYNDKIWDLETENGSLKDSLARTQSDFSKIFQDKTANESIIDELKSQVETLKIQKVEFETESVTKLTQLKESLSELKTRNSSLNDENDQLVQKVETLSTELTEAKEIATKQQPQLKEVSLKADTDESFDFDESILLQPSDAEMKGFKDSSEGLEAETLKSNLDHAYGIITKLRHSMLKIKHDNDNLLTQLESSSSGPRTTPSPSHDKVKLFMRKKLQLDNASGLSPSKRQSKTLSYIDTTDSSYTGDVDWENFEGVDDQTTTHSSPSRLRNIPALVKSDDDEEDFEDASDIVNDAGTDVISVKSTKTAATGRSLGSRDILSSPLSPRPRLLSEELSHATTPKEVSLKEIEEYAKQHRLKLISETEYESLRVKPSSHSQEKAIAGAAALGLLALPSVGSEKHTSAILDSLKQKCEEYNLVPVKQSEYDRLLKAANYDEIDETVLLKKVDKFGLKLLPLTEYEEIENKFAEQDQEIQILNNQFSDVDYLSDRVKELGYFALPSIEYDGLKSNLNNYEKKHITLNETLTASQATHSKLQKTLDTRDLKIGELDTTVATKEKEIEELKDSLDSHEKEVAHLKGEFTSKTNEITELKYYIVSKEKEMGELAGSVTTKSREISELKESVTNKTNEINDMKGAVVSKENEIAKLNDTIKSNNLSISELTETVESKDKKIVALNDELLTKSEELMSVSKNLAVNEKELSEHKSKLAKPSADFVRSSAALLGLTAVPIVAHQKASKDLDEKVQIIKDTQELVKSREKEILALKADLKSKSAEIKSLETKIEKPSSDFVCNSAALLGLTAIPIIDHEKTFKELDEKTKAIKDSKELVSAKEQLISELKTDLQNRSAEIETLKTQLEEPDIVYVTKKASSHGLHVLSQEEYGAISKQVVDQKKELASHKSILKDKESELSLNVEELKSLKKQLLDKHSALENLEQELKGKRLSLKDLENDLKNKHSSLEALETELSEKKSELDTVKKQVEEPDVEYIKVKSEGFGLVPIPMQEHHSMKKQLEEHKLLVGSQSELLKKAELDLTGAEKQIEIHEASLSSKDKELKTFTDALAYTQQELDSHKSDLLSKHAELESTRSKLDAPDIEFIHEKATSHGMVVVDSENHKQLQSDLNTFTKNAAAAEETLASKEKEISDLRLLLTSKDTELSELKAARESPDLSYITSHAQARNMVLVPVKEYDVFKKPALNVNSKEMFPSSTNSSTEHIVVKSEEHTDSHVIPVPISVSGEGHNDLVKAINSKNKLLEDLAKEIESKDSKIEVLQHNIESPTNAYLGSKASDAGLVLLPVNDYEQFVESIKALDTSKTKAVPSTSSEVTSVTGFAVGGVLGMAAASIAALKRSSEKPSVDYLISNLNKNGYTSIPKSQYDSLVTAANSDPPSSPQSSKVRHVEGVETMDILKKKCASMGLVALSTSSYDSLIVSSKRSLTTVELIDRIEKSGMVALTRETYLALLDLFSSLGSPFDAVISKLRDPSNSDFKSSLTELKALIENQNKITLSYESPSSDYVTEKAQDLGYKVITLHDYAELREKKMTVDESKRLLESNGFQVVPNESYSKLNEMSSKVEEPNEDFVKQLAAVCGLSVLAVGAHEKLKNDSTIAEKAQGELETKSAELQTASIKLAEIERNLETARAEVSQRNEELAKVKEELEHPSENFIRSKAGALGLVALLATQHEALQKNVDDQKQSLIVRNNEFSDLETRLASKQDELSNLKSQLEDPDFVKSKAIDHGFVALPTSTHTDLNNKLDNVVEELKLKSDELTSKDDELSELKKQLDNPEFVKSRAAEHGFVPVPVSDHSNLNQRLNDTLAELKLRSDELASKSVELDALKKQFESPDAEYLKRKSGSHGFVPIPIPVHKELKNNLADAQGLVEKLKAQIADQLVELEKSKSALADRNSSIKSLTEQLENPDAGYVKSKSGLHGLVAVPLSEHKELNDSVNANTSKIEDLESQIAQRHAELEEVKTELAHKHAQVEQLNQQLANPDLDYVKSKSESHGLIAIPLGEHKELSKSANDNVSKIQELEGQISEKHGELEQVKAELSDKHATTATLTRQIEKPDVEYLKSKAELHGMITIPAYEFTKVKESLAIKEKELSSIKEKLDKEVESDSEFTDAGVFVPITPAEPSTHQSNDVAVASVKLNEVKAELDAKAKELADIQTKLDSKRNELQLSASQPQFTPPSTQAKSVIAPLSEPSSVESANTASVSTDGNKLINALKLQIADLEQQLSAYRNNDDSGLKTKLATVGAVGAAGLAAVSAKEYNDLKSNLAAKNAEIERLKSQEPTTATDDLKLLSMKDAKLFESDSASLNPTVSHDDVSIVNPTVSPVITGEKRFTNPLTSLLGLGSNRGSISGYGDTSSTAKDLQITELNKKIENPSKEYLVEKLAVLGYSAIPDRGRARESVITNSTGTDSSLYLDAASGTGANNSLYGEHLGGHQSNDSGFVDAYSQQGSESDSDVNALFEPATETEESKLREEARKYGYMLVPIGQTDDDNATSIDEITDVHLGTAEIQTIRPDSELRPASTIRPTSSIRPDSTIVLDNPIFEEGSQANDRTFLKAKAATMGMEVIPTAELLMLREHQHPDISKLRELAAGLGVSVVEKQNASNTKSISVSDEDVPPLLTKESLQRYAHDLGLKVFSKTEVERMKRRSITSQDLAAKAAELNLTLLPESRANSKREVGDLTRDDLAIEAKNQGLMVIPENQFVATTVSRKPDVPHVVVLPSTYYNKLLRSHEFYKINKVSSPTTAKHPESLASPTEELTSMVSSFNTAPSSPAIEQFKSVSQTPISTRVPPHQFNNSPRSIQKSGSQKFNQAVTPNHSPSLNSGNQFSLTELDRVPSSALHSLRSVHTVITSKHEMIAAITQTIIGEYLYKYFRKLGPLSSMSESRHERFFWIHPYSLTLYWSSSNPVFNDPSSNKIRALAIVSVESVEDNNPLPPGLFHKSIVVHSKDKSIKITCPTRQRHNIWFNSLKYLIERNTDDLLADDDEGEDQYNEPFALDHKVELERSQTFRHSQPRKYVLGGTHLSSRSVSSPPITTATAPPKLKSSRSLLGSVRNTRR